MNENVHVGFPTKGKDLEDRELWIIINEDTFILQRPKMIGVKFAGLGPCIVILMVMESQSLLVCCWVEWWGSN